MLNHHRSPINSRTGRLIRLSYTILAREKFADFNPPTLSSELEALSGTTLNILRLIVLLPHARQLLNILHHHLGKGFSLGSENGLVRSGKELGLGMERREIGDTKGPPHQVIQ